MMRHSLVDRIIELEPGVRAVGMKNVALSEDVFRDHFPGNPVYPGAYLLEGLAQTAGALIERSTGGRFALMTSVDRLRFGALVRPGEQLRYEVTIEELEPTHARIRGEATVAGRTVASGRISFAVLDIEQVIPPLYVPLWRQELGIWFGEYPEPGNG
jgi:3-hydroxyacyl-[acyl-carrier-protein] dehydratase